MVEVKQKVNGSHHVLINSHQLNILEHPRTLTTNPYSLNFFGPKSKYFPSLSNHVCVHGIQTYVEVIRKRYNQVNITTTWPPDDEETCTNIIGRFPHILQQPRLPPSWQGRGGGKCCVDKECFRRGASRIENVKGRVSQVQEGEWGRSNQTAGIERVSNDFRHCPRKNHTGIQRVTANLRLKH